MLRVVSGHNLMVSGQLTNRDISDDVLLDLPNKQKLTITTNKQTNKQTINSVWSNNEHNEDKFVKMKIHS